MIPSVRAAGAMTNVDIGGGSPTTLNVTLPACSAGDLLLIFTAKFATGFGVTGGMSAPSGWAPVAEVTGAQNFEAWQRVFSKTAVASDSGATVPITVNGVTSSNGAHTVHGVAVAVKDWFGTDKIATNTGYNVNALTAPVVTTAHACLLVESWAAQRNWSPGISLTLPATVLAVSPATTSLDNLSPLLGVSSQAQSSPGTTTPVSAGNTNGIGADYSAVTIAIYGSSPPNAPILGSPANGQSINDTAGNRFTWTFSDPDPGDSQSAFDLRYSADSGVSWTTVSGSTPNQFVDFPAGTFTDGDYEWQVRTYDAAGNQGPWSASGFFTAISPPGVPTVTSPISGETVSSTPTPVTWAFANQQAYRVRLVADSGGVADTSTVYFDTGQVTSSDTRSVNVPFDTNGIYAHILVSGQSQGLWSGESDTRVRVSYSLPPAPSVAVAADDATASILVTVTTPDPTVDQAAATYVDLFRSDDGGVTGVRVASQLATNSTWRDYTPASGVDYSYRAVSFAASGTSSASLTVGGGGSGGGASSGAYGVGDYGEGPYGG